MDGEMPRLAPIICRVGAVITASSQAAAPQIAAIWTWPMKLLDPAGGLSTAVNRRTRRQFSWIIMNAAAQTATTKYATRIGSGAIVPTNPMIAVVGTQLKSTE